MTAIFKEDGLFDEDAFDRAEKNVWGKIGPQLRYAQDVLVDAIKEHDPVTAGRDFKWNNLRSEIDFANHTFVIKTRALREQDPEVHYVLPDEGVTYTYEDTNFDDEFSLYGLPETNHVKVYHKDWGKFMRAYDELFVEYKVTSVEDNHRVDMNREGTEVSETLNEFGALYVGCTAEFYVSPENLKTTATPAHGVDRGYRSIVLTNYRDYKLTVEILPNPTVEAVNPGIAGGALNINRSSLLEREDV